MQYAMQYAICMSGVETGAVAKIRDKGGTGAEINNFGSATLNHTEIQYCK